SSDPTISVLPRLDSIKRSSFGPLITNSSWIGKQRSGTKSYDVQVQIIHLDLDSGLGSGLLKIFGLTNDLPTMMTFFDIEIIGNKHNFLTQAWGSTEPADSEHWSKFGPFKDYLNQLSSEVRGLEKWWSNQPFLFMRWKEKFLVGDYASEDTNGASFAGFYYVCIEL
ncbi:vacuolar import/degradation protein Vid24, partial [Phakopsora pachyrhizi]